MFRKIASCKRVDAEEVVYIGRRNKTGILQKIVKTVYAAGCLFELFLSD
jgi:hypothetical protein